MNEPASRMPCYPSDMTDEEWQVLQPHIPVAKTGRPRTVDVRAIIDALFYMTRTGCQWRYLPIDFPPWEHVYYYFRTWSQDGTLDRINTALRRAVRIAEGRDAEPSAGVIDSQSVKSTENSDPDTVGYDAGKQVKGRKRHVLVDTLGLLLLVVVTTADLQDAAGAKQLGTKAQGRFTRFVKVWADRAYRGSLIDWFARLLHWCLEIVEHPADQVGFRVQPKRWIVERTLGWLNRFRRLSKDYEWHIASSEGVVYLASIRLLLARLADDRRVTRMSS